MPDDTKPEAKPVILQVFPNTGHHFFTVPLEELLPTKPLAYLEKLVQQNRGPFEVWHETVPWIRYQYDRTERDSLPVIKIAIESNLGLPKRGFLYHLEGEWPERPETPSGTSPYACDSELRLQQNFPDRMLELLDLPTKDGASLPINCKVFFCPPAGRDPVNVDLIVDLGNTRTAAVLLESPGRQQVALERRIWPLRVVARASQFEMASFPKEIVGSMARVGAVQDDCAVFDSWLLLHRTLFAHLEPPMSEKKATVEFEKFFSQNLGRTMWGEKRYLPHAFVEFSPALLGGGKSADGAAKTLARIPLNTSARFYLSSPKRYVWNNELTGVEGKTIWFQIPNPWERRPDSNFYVPLSGLFRYFMAPDDGEVPGGCDLTLDRLGQKDQPLVFPTSNPIYPLRDALCWYALSLLEAAYRQINSLAYLRAAGTNILPRRLRHIRVTYPDGWTMQERQAYLAQWKRAVQLFAMTHFEDPRPLEIREASGTLVKGGEGPIFVEKHFGEAVSAQLPILYADIQSLLNDGNAWVNLYGSDESVVVMNLDIGGGTTDLAIIQYRNRGGPGTASLRSRLLFRHGHPIAGDMLVKAIIEKVLLPAWVKASDTGQYQGHYPIATDWLIHLFKRPTFKEIIDVEPFAEQKLMRIIRLVFVPLVNELLQRLILHAESPDSAWEPLDLKACQGAEIIDANTLNDLNELCRLVVQRRCPNAASWSGKVFAENARVLCKPEDLEACIEEVFSDMFYNLGALAARFKCQLLIVAGKPSELPRVRELLLRSFPLLPQRIVQVKNFPAGQWYPFASADGKIKDAKTCTVVGAALHQAMCNGDLENFVLQDESVETFTRNYYWGRIPSGGLASDFYNREHLLFSPRDYPTQPDPRDPDRLVLEKECELPLNCRIGRQIVRMKDVDPAPVYKLTCPVPVDANGTVDHHVKVRVKLRWVSIKGEGDKLELLAVTPPEHAPQLQPQDVKLQLNTLLDEWFWMDQPRLEVDHLFDYKKTAPKR